MGWLDTAKQVTLPADMIVQVEQPKVRFVADVHLGKCTATDRQDFAELLERYEKATSVHLVVLGDFLDLLCCADGEYTHGYTEMRQSLGILAAQERLTWVIGNHDIRVRDRLFGYREPRSGAARNFESKVLKDYRKVAANTDLPSLFSMHKCNSYHRYACLKTNQGNWLLCHGDEINFGRAWKHMPFVKDHWLDWLFAMWRAMDASPSLLLRTGQSVEKTFGDLFSKGVDAVIAYLKRKDPSFTTEVSSQLQFLRETDQRDELEQVFADELAMHVDRLEEGLISETVVSAEAQAVTEQMLVELHSPFSFTLSEARKRVTAPCADDCPGGSDTSLNLNGLIIGHRHKSEIVPNLPGPGISLVADAGTWHEHGDDNSRGWILTLENSKLERQQGRKDHPEA